MDVVTTTRSAPGFFGKVITHGDFVSRRMPRTFIDTWDPWLQQCLTCSREQLGDQWLDAYLTSPIWRFGLAAGLCGDAPWLGVMIPGVDRVGRYFPLTIATALPAGSRPLKLILSAEAWFAEAARLALATLDEQLDLATFDDHVRRLGTPAERDTPYAHSPDAPQAWHFHLSSEPTAQPDWRDIAAQLVHGLLPVYSVWHSDGSERVAPSLMVRVGLPRMQEFAALLDGSWERRGWQCLPLPHATPDGVSMTASPHTLAWHSVHRTDSGRIRDHNEDACLDLPASRIWVVADGMGGHDSGEVASARIIEALRQIGPQESLETHAELVRAQLTAVNASLRELLAGRPGGGMIGSTVVVLLAGSPQWAVIWAGDSRAYLYRDRQLQQLTRDHSMVNEMVAQGLLTYEQAVNHPDAHVITRAIGGVEPLQLDTVTFAVRAGDRIVLCSDGLTNEVSAAEITTILETTALDAVAETLVDRALGNGGKDNVTAVAVEVTNGSGGRH